MSRRATDIWGLPGAAVLGLAMVWAFSLRPEGLAAGGVAPLAVAVAVGAFVGAPLAMVEWREPATGSAPRHAAADAVADLWSILLISAAVAPWVGAWAALVWLPALIPDGRAAVVATALALLAAGASAVAGAMVAPPWTLLEPGWATWSEWLPGAVVGGILLAGSGFGRWSAHASRRPGRPRLPWAVGGLAALVAVAVVVRHGSWFEATAGSGSVDPVAAGVVAVGAAAGAIGVLAPCPGFSARWPRAAQGALATLWFAGPGAGSLPVFWASILPLGLALVTGVRAFDLAGSSRWIAWAATGVLAGAAVAGWPGLPAQMGAAAAVGLLVVVAFWLGGTRALLARAS